MKTTFQVMVDLVPANGVPEWIEILPAPDDSGMVKSRDGRWLRVDPEQFVGDNNRSGQQWSIDIDHRADDWWDYDTQAYGWAIELATGAQLAAKSEEHEQVAARSVWARIQWCDDGADLVERRKFRSVSPTMLVRRIYETVDGDDIVIIEPTELVGISLTNRPALRVKSLYAMDVKSKILAKLELGPDATPEEVVEAIEGLKAEKSTPEPLPRLDEAVPRADYDALMNRVTQAEAKLSARKKADEEATEAAKEASIEAELQAALKDGVITPATVDYHRANCRREGGLDDFRKFRNAAPKLCTDEQIQRAAKPRAGATGLTQQQLKICKKLKIPPEQYARTLSGDDDKEVA